MTSFGLPIADESPNPHTDQQLERARAVRDED
jgi:hypothetical protein